jgi:drug/metabolite transporter (DMT)-like permease
MYRSPIAIVLAVVSAIMMLIGRLNHDLWWGDPLFVAGIVVLVFAGALNVYLGRRRRSVK